LWAKGRGGDIWMAFTKILRPDLFDAEHCAEFFWIDPDPPFLTWVQLTETDRKYLVDQAQLMLDGLKAWGIIG
jgi:hypothetical protein